MTCPTSTPQYLSGIHSGLTAAILVMIGVLLTAVTLYFVQQYHQRQAVNSQFARHTLKSDTSFEGYMREQDGYTASI